MREGFDKAKDEEPRAKALYEAAFGTKADSSRVEEVIKSLETGTARAQVATQEFDNGQIAAVDWTKPDKRSKKAKTTLWAPSDIMFSEQFHGMSGQLV